MTVAFNTQHTGDRSRDHRGYAEPFTSEQVDGLLSEDWLRRMVGDIRNGQEELRGVERQAALRLSALRALQGQP